MMPDQSGLDGRSAARERASGGERCWCSRCRTTRATFARRSRPGRAATCLKEAADAEARRGHPARSRPAADTCIRSSERGWSPPRRPSGAPGRGGSALGPRARGPAAAGARAHEPGDREELLHLGADRRDAPRPHHAEAAARAAPSWSRYALSEGLLESLLRTATAPPCGGPSLRRRSPSMRVRRFVRPSRLRLAPEGQRRLPGSEGAADGEDPEADAAEQQRRSRPPSRRARVGRPCSWRSARS